MEGNVHSGYVDNATFYVECRGKDEKGEDVLNWPLSVDIELRVLKQGLARWGFALEPDCKYLYDGQYCAAAKGGKEVPCVYAMTRIASLK